jgi:hypothetical protein
VNHHHIIQKYNAYNSHTTYNTSTSHLDDTMLAQISAGLPRISSRLALKHASDAPRWRMRVINLSGFGQTKSLSSTSPGFDHVYANRSVFVTVPSLPPKVAINPRPDKTKLWRQKTLSPSGTGSDKAALARSTKHMTQIAHPLPSKSLIVPPAQGMNVSS